MAELKSSKLIKDFTKEECEDYLNRFKSAIKENDCEFFANAIVQLEERLAELNG